MIYLCHPCTGREWLSPLTGWLRALVSILGFGRALDILPSKGQTAPDTGCPDLLFALDGGNSSLDLYISSSCTTAKASKT